MSLLPPTAADGTPLSSEPMYGLPGPDAPSQPQADTPEVRTSAPGTPPPAARPPCDCPACRIAKALRDAFPNAKADPLAAFASAPESAPESAELRAAADLVRAARHVRDLNDGPAAAAAAFGVARNPHEKTLLDVIEDGLNESLAGLTAAAGAAGVLWQLRQADFAEAAERR